MNRNLAFLAGGLALCLVCLGVMLYPRDGTAADKEGKAAKADKNAPRIAASKIVHVTVYPDSALISREVEVPAGTGLMELVVNPLPEATITSTLYTESAEGLRVLTTRFRTRAVREDTREEVRKIEEEIKGLQAKQRKIQSDVQILADSVSFMTQLEKFTAANTTHATEKGKLDSDQIIALAKYLNEGRAEKAKKAFELKEQILENTEALEFASRKMRELSGGSSKIERDAILVIDKQNNAAGKVKLNYLVSAAAWRPQYKFRADKNGKASMQVEQLAAIIQQTGEDWDRVSMTLSTAQPMLNAAPPELHALAVDVVPRGTAGKGVTLSGLQTGLNLGAVPGGGPPMGGGFGPGRPGTMPMPRLPTGGRLAIQNPGMSAKAAELDAAAKLLRQQAQNVANLKKEKDAAELQNYAAVLDQVKDLCVSVEASKRRPGDMTGMGAKNEGPSVTYHLAHKLSVPSRTDDQVIEVSRLEMKPEFFYKAVPVLTPHVYRQAKITNDSKNVLLPGEATMYVGTDFVGRMSLPLVAVGEEFTIGLGTDTQLQVQRQLLERTNTTQGGNQIWKYDYRILISSYKAEKVKVQVWDRLPSGETEKLGVTLVKATPELCDDPVYKREERSMNLLRWDVEVGPENKGEKAKKIAYEFKLEFDRMANFGSFLSK
jgi:hypothetical protein